MTSVTEYVTLRVTRYRPEQEDEPSAQEYQVPVHKDWTVLDGLNYIKDHVDGTLSYRWSCRMGICGSCGMTINGEPKLSCATFLSSFQSERVVRVEPLRNFPIIRDLVTELTDFMHKLGLVKPWLIRDEEDGEPGPDEEYLQTPAQLDAYKQFSMCINCMLCYSACPVYGLDSDFVGPAAIALAQRYNLDSRDDGQHERLTVLGMPGGVWSCTYVGECSRACPKGVDPAGAIQRAKLSVANAAVRSLLLPWSGR